MVFGSLYFTGDRGKEEEIHGDDNFPKFLTKKDVQKIETMQAIFPEGRGGSALSHALAHDYDWFTPGSHGHTEAFAKR
jgi:hypothetical protein